MNSKTEGACESCGSPTKAFWCDHDDPRRRVAHLCGDCAEDLFVDEIDDYGDEFPEESHDDLLPDDFES
jgi:hypothetical protein